MSEISARQALALWQQADLLDPAKAGELAGYLDRQHPVPGGMGRLTKVFSTLGAVLVGLGLILFVASNWGGLGPLARGIILLAAYGSLVGLAALSGYRGYETVAGALWFLATLSLGANIFLLGQIFNFSLTYWQGPFLWMVGALAMGYALQSRLHAWLAAPLAILALGWLQGGAGWFRDDQWQFMVGPSGLLPLFPLIGLGLLSLGLLCRATDRWQFAGSIWVLWGAVLTVAPLVVAGIHPDLLQGMFTTALTLKQGAIIGGALALVALGLIYGELRAKQNRLVLVIAVVFCAGLVWMGSTALVDRLDDRLVFAIFNVCVFALVLALIWSGIASSDVWLVNLGMVAAMAFILIQYFSWSLRLLDRSIAFILGGMVLLALSVWGERQRRRLVARISR